MSVDRKSTVRKLALVLLVTGLLVRPALADGDYVFILKARGNPYWQAMVDGIQETAHAQGISAIVYQLSSETAAEEQLNTCMTAIAEHPRLIAISSVTSAVGLACMKAAVKQNILVADMDANILPKDAETAGFKLAYSVGSDNYLIGQEAADYLKKISAKADQKVLVLAGSAGSVPGRKRVGGFTDQLTKILPQARLVATLPADWDRLKAMNATSDILQREPDLDVIYAANDQMALGAIEAIRSRGEEKPIIILSVDGTADGRKAVLDRKMSATVAQLPYLVGKRAVEKAIAVAGNQATELVEATPTPVLDRAMLEAGKEPLLQYVR